MEMNPADDDDVCLSTDQRNHFAVAFKATIGVGVSSAISVQDSP